MDTLKNTLFTPLQLGRVSLKHRVVLAPLTRLRSEQPGNVPGPLSVTYYDQRASSGGLLITEATNISAQAQGYPGAPGIHSDAQIKGWKSITEAVHAKGGVIFLQLWHTGRISHPSLQPEGATPVAPSAVRPAGTHLNAAFETVTFETPRAMEEAEILALVNDFQQAAENGMAANFDGVELHSANGYLLDQFLQDGSNQRNDQYGGSIENRARVLLAVVDAVTSVWEPDRVGVRLSPYGTFNDMYDSDPVALFSYVVHQLSARRLAYLHLVEPRANEASSTGETDYLAPSATGLFRQYFDGVLISAGGYEPDSAALAVANGTADAVAFGRHFISNPDLPQRLQSNRPLNAYDRSTFYGGSARGYTDYPTLTE